MPDVAERKMSKKGKYPPKQARIGTYEMSMERIPAEFSEANIKTKRTSGRREKRVEP